MNLKYIFLLFLLYLFGSGMHFLILSEGDFQTDLSRQLFRAAVLGLGPVLGLAIGYW